MKPIKQAVSLIVGIAIVALLSSCGTQSKFASTFGKRHYTKGFYWDSPGSIKPVVAIVDALVDKQNVLPKISTSATTYRIAKGSAVTSGISISVTTKRPKSKIAQLVINAVTPKYVKDLPPSVSSINSHHESSTASTSNGSGLLSIFGFLTSILAVFFALLWLLLSALSVALGGGISGLVYVAIPFIVSIGLCLAAIVTHDADQGLAIAGLVIDILFGIPIIDGLL
jgi:hypothetical protein